MQENTDTRPPLAVSIVMALVMVVACYWTVAGVPSWVPVIDGQYVTGQIGEAQPDSGICALPFSLVGEFGGSIRISYNGVSRIHPGGEARWGLALAE